MVRSKLFSSGDLRRTKDIAEIDNSLRKATSSHLDIKSILNLVINNKLNQVKAKQY